MGAHAGSFFAAAAADRRRADPLLQLDHPSCDLLVVAREGEVMLELLERLLRLGEIQIVQHAQVQIRGRIVRFHGDGVLIGRLGLGELAEFSFRDAELVAGDGVVGIARECRLEGAFGIGDSARRAGTEVPRFTCGPANSG